MKKNKLLTSIILAPLLVSCGGANEDFSYDTPQVDVDSISFTDLKRDVLTGEIAGDENVKYFDFYEVSDFHGAVNYSVDEKTIGLSKMGDYFRKKREVNPGGTVVISGGDMYQGSAESNFTHGYVVNYAMNIMGFETMTLGNHEFDWSLSWLKKNQELAVENHQITYLGANVFEKESGKLPDFLKASEIITRGDYKIGIIGTLGYGAEKSVMKSLIESLRFEKELPIVKAEAKRLKEEENCDIVIWSSHKDAQELTQEGLTKEDGIDAVFGGHSHRNYPGEGETTTYVDGVPYLETRNIGRGIAHARVTLDIATRNVINRVGEVDIDPYKTEGLVDHEEILKVMNAYNAKIDPIKKQVIGSTDDELDVSDTFSLTNLGVDTMRIAANKYAKENGDMKISASFHNANGGVRANISKGDITFGDVYKSFPFDNEICIVKTTGKKFKTYLRKALSYGVWRDTSLKSFNDIVDNQDYYFVTTDFMATADSFVFKLGEDDLIRTGYIVRDAVAGRIKTLGKISAASYRRTNEQFNTITK